jgi:hypothetical protein
MPRRKALLIGINYFGTKHQLSGCINDAMNMKDYLVRDRGYSAGHHDMVRIPYPRCVETNSKLF